MILPPRSPTSWFVKTRRAGRTSDCSEATRTALICLSIPSGRQSSIGQTVLENVARIQAAEKERARWLREQAALERERQQRERGAAERERGVR